MLVTSRVKERPVNGDEPSLLLSPYYHGNVPRCRAGRYLEIFGNSVAHKSKEYPKKS